jgi:N-acylneuraminate cytidylyltransferase
VDRLVSDERTIAIILARAGSRGLPGKNHALVAGKACVWWTIRHAVRSSRIGRVLVSTDCPHVMRVARDANVTIVERPPALAADDTPVDEAARHAVGQAQDPPERIALLYANVPVRPDDLTDRADELLERTGADSVQSYTGVGKHHPLWTARLEEVTGAVRPWEGEALNGGIFRRQDLPPAFIPDGGCLVVRRDALTLGGGSFDASDPHRFLGADRRGVLTRPGEVVDIDSPIDRVVADAILRDRFALGPPSLSASASAA